MTTSTDLFDGDFWHDPYPAYAALRADEPVRRIDVGGGSAWLLSRYADVRAALADPRLSKDWRWSLPAEQRADAPGLPVPMMVLMDPPEHTRLRKLVSRTFTLRRMEDLRPQVRGFADELIDALPADIEVDILAEYAFLVPVFVICELLGVPADDRDEFAAWSTVMVDQGEGGAEESMAAMVKLNGYLVELVAAKRAHPDDALISGLIEVVDDGDRLSEEELVAMAMLLLVAGHETAVNLIANGLLALWTQPVQRALLQQHPALIETAVDEFLRFDSPVHTTPARFATEDIEYSGATIPAGSQVMLSLAAANHDPDRFADAGQLHVDRDAGGHLAFGHGLHHCLGAQLARIEGQEAIGRLLARRPDARLAVEPAEIAHRQSNLVRGLRSLPVVLGSEARH